MKRYQELYLKYPVWQKLSKIRLFSSRRKLFPQLYLHAKNITNQQSSSELFLVIQELSYANLNI